MSLFKLCCNFAALTLLFGFVAAAHGRLSQRADSADQPALPRICKIKTAPSADCYSVKAKQVEPKGSASEGSDKAIELKALVKQQRNSLNNVVSLLTTYYSEGKVDLSRLLQAHRDLLRANLQLYDDPKDRVEAIKECMKTVKVLVSAIEEKVKLNFARGVDELEAKVVLREFEIELLRAEIQANRGK